jgi:hypothetical protein
MTSRRLDPALLDAAMLRPQINERNSQLLLLPIASSATTPARPFDRASS